MIDRRLRRPLLGFALLLGFAACHTGESASEGGPAFDARTDGDAGTTPVLFECTPISEGAREGCRSSDELSCERCCLPAQPDSCTMWSVPCQMVVAGQSIGDYCGVFALPGQCPADCRPCASCSKFSEATLCSLRPTIGACDCPNVDIREDPCIAPQSCACLCRTY